MTGGETIAGRYEVGERLGVGGMSTVQRAFDRRLERHVAVKLLAEHLVDDEQFVSRFRREALAAARLVHPNVVQVFDFGLDETSGRHYIVMELIRGRSGAELLREHGHLHLDEALAVLTQACRGLDYAHRNGVVHRDVKPGNLLRSEDGVTKLADFGIAKAVSDESAITQIGSVLGTASYLAPEQARGEEAGPAADIYALGVVSYQLLSGRLPYEATSLTELALKQQREAPAWLHEVNPEVPEPLAQAVDRALALDAGERYDSAEQMRRTLDSAGRGVMPAPHNRDATSVATAATSVSPQRQRQSTEDRPEVASPSGPRRPRQPRAARTPPPVPAPVAAPAKAPKQPRAKRKGRLRRLFAYLLLLALLAGGGFAAVVLTSADDTAVQIREVTGDTVDDIVGNLTSLIDDNTQ